MLLALLLGFGTLALVSPASPALAYTKPPTDWSWYVQTSDTSAAKNLGCNQGSYDASYGSSKSSEVVLDFGGQNYSNTGTILTFDGYFMSYSMIEAWAEAYADGYWLCTGSDLASTLYMDLGTNTSLSTSYGGAWANVVNVVDNYVRSHWGQVVTQGANDIEAGFNTFYNSNTWAQAFGANTSKLYLNYGSADGCSTSSYNNSQICNGGWSQWDYWWISWGYAAAIAAPEIYYSNNAWQWTRISQYGRYYQNDAAWYLAPWDEYTLNTSTFTAQGAWDALTTDMGTSFDYSMEIHRQ